MYRARYFTVLVWMDTCIAVLSPLAPGGTRKLAGVLRVCLLLGLVIAGCDGEQKVERDELSINEPARLDLEQVFAADVDATRPLALLPQFSDRAADAGLLFSYHSDEPTGDMNMPETFSGGIACFDMDLDGWCDVFLPNGRRFPLEQPSTEFRDGYFRNVGGRFVEATQASGITGFQYSHGCSFGDINADGFPDLAVANFGTCEIYLNQGDGTFLKQEDPAITARPSWWMVVLLADLDADQLPDLYAVPYVDWTIDGPLSVQVNGPGYPGPNDFGTLETATFLNNGDGSWTDRSTDNGLLQDVKAMAAVAVDLDHDLKTEIFIANDSTSNDLLTRSRNLHFNELLTNGSRNKNDVPLRKSNDFEGHWLEIGEISGTAADISGAAAASMSATVADFDRNGLPDLLVTNYFRRNNSLYGNRGGLNFSDMTLASRMDAIGRSVLSFGATPVDYDLDGNWDLIIANGHVLGPNTYVYKMKHQMIRNVDGAFVDISSQSGPYFNEVESLGRSTASLDFDNDGDSDVIMTHVNRPVALLENQTPRTNHWIRLDVDDPRQRPMEGGRIELIVPDQPTIPLPITAGGSYLSDGQKSWTVGLGPNWTKDQTCVVKVYWPDGQEDQWELTIDRGWRLLPGRTQQLPLSIPVVNNATQQGT